MRLPIRIPLSQYPRHILHYNVFCMVSPLNGAANVEQVVTFQMENDIVMGHPHCPPIEQVCVRGSSSAGFQNAECYPELVCHVSF